MNPTLQYIEQQKNLYNLIILFIEKDSDFLENDQDIDLQNLIKYIENQKITSSKDDFRLFLLIISRISDNHHRYAKFLSKIEQILIYFGEQMNKNFSNCEIFDIFKNNKKILLFLFEKKIITADIYILKSIYTKKKSEIRDFTQFFYPEFKSVLESEKEGSLKLEETILQLCNQNFDIFEEKRKNGENDGYISELIRKDMYDKFSEYVNNTNLSPSSMIERSLFETNLFLLKEKETSLIEYAAFCGSIQTFKYLLLKNAELRPRLWLYAIHGQNSEIIHLLEEKHVEPKDKSFEEILKESIKCHHNEIANYIIENFLNIDVDKNNLENEYDKNSLFYCFHYYNFESLPNNFDEFNFAFYYSCDYGYITLFNLFLNNKKDININGSVILKQKVLFSSQFFLDFS